MESIAKIVVEDATYELSKSVDNLPVTALAKSIEKGVRPSECQDWRGEFKQQVEQLGKEDDLHIKFSYV